MSALLLAWLVLQGPSEGYTSAMEAVDRGHYQLAWEQVQGLAPAERLRGSATVLARAGDLVGVLRVAQEGLAAEPGDLELLFHAASSAISLRDAERSASFLERLADAVEAADLAPEHRPGWEQVVERFRGHVAELEGAGKEKARALASARLLSGITLALVGVGIGLLGLRGRVPQG